MRSCYSIKVLIIAIIVGNLYASSSEDVTIADGIYLYSTVLKKGLYENRVRLGDEVFYVESEPRVEIGKIRNVFGPVRDGDGGTSVVTLKLLAKANSDEYLSEFQRYIFIANGEVIMVAINISPITDTLAIKGSENRINKIAGYVRAKLEIINSQKIPVISGTFSSVTDATSPVSK